MLRLELLPADRAFPVGTTPTLRARAINDGAAPLALTFWWTRTMRVRDRDGVVVAPGPGPVLPCGAAEEWTVLAPGEVVERDETLTCTQPAGAAATIGWRYALPVGTWRVTLIHRSPPAHGFTQAPPHPQAFVGTVESNEVELVVVEAPGFLARLAQRFTPG